MYLPVPCWITGYGVYSWEGQQTTVNGWIFQLFECYTGGYVSFSIEWVYVCNKRKVNECGYSNNKPPIFDGLYHPFMVIRGMVYYCYTNIRPIITHLQLGLFPTLKLEIPTISGHNSNILNDMKWVSARNGGWAPNP